MLFRRWLWPLGLSASVVLNVCALPSRLPAQSLTAGSLRGAVLSLDGRALTGVEITLERADGTSFLFVESGRDGTFSIPLLQPGSYRVLVEQIGYQPIRYMSVPVAAGQTTVLTARLEERPPPILAPTEVSFGGTMGGSAMGPVLGIAELNRFDLNQEATAATKSVSQVATAGSGRSGLGGSGLGLGGGFNQLYVDGLPLPLLRHPGLTAEAGAAPGLFRGALAQGQVVQADWDAEWRGYPGLVLSGHSTRGGDRLTFQPFVAIGSAGLGAAAEDNPADSSAYSIQAGATLSGAIVPDTAHFALRADFQSLRTPAAHPWASAPALGEALQAVATFPYAEDISQFIAPVVRSSEAVSAQGRIDWRLGSNQVLARFGYASWNEENPVLGDELSNLSGAKLDGADVSAGVSVTSGRAGFANELRIGFASAKREWTAPSLVATVLADEGIAFGGSGGLPATFNLQTIDVTDALQIGVGAHRVKLGGGLQVMNYEQDYRFGASGHFTFGDLASFESGQGAYFQTAGPSQALADPTITDIGVFAQDSWAVSPEISVLLGLRYDTQSLPSDAIQADATWTEATGIPNNFIPTDRKGISPRFGVLWDVQNRGEWVFSGGGGLYQGRLDPALLSEAMLFDGPTTVRRGFGDLGLAWPGAPAPTVAPTVGPRLTLFNSTYRNPRSFKTGLGLTRAWANGIRFRLSGLLAHTDFLPRREDLNRSAAAATETQEGRPVYGTLVKAGGLVQAEPTTNRRFDDYDLVSGISPTGFSDYVELSASLERQVRNGLSLLLAYTFSRAEDNVPGQRFLDPADQLSPFPEGLNGADWTDGRSDFDAPHRVVAYGEYRSSGSTPIALGARFRYRSGLPFTPGFRPGVDLNGDGAGNNDPAFLDGGLTGIGGLLSGAGCSNAALNSFAVRNACREEAVSALDVRLEVGLPMRLSGESRLSLVLDAFNVVSTETGIIDRALVLVDPGAPLQSAAGQVTVPLIINPNFGTILSRRTEPRTVRVALRVEY